MLRKKLVGRQSLALSPKTEECVTQKTLETLRGSESVKLNLAKRFLANAQREAELARNIKHQLISVYVQLRCTFLR